MGVIQRVFDDNLRRAVARKILGKGPSGSDSRQSDPRSVGRFLEEAQVTAQLEHPGIVPVHELGLDGEGKLYFTMRLVKGEDLHRIYERVREGSEGWTVTRALHALLRVCEAMSYAHRKGVVHRDLKPANVMVGRFGEVYVMDWGLARVLDAPETKDVRLAPPPSTGVHTDRERLEEGTPDSPLVTLDGDVVGTPAYMSPEQARGELDEIGPASDVYALGAMLYHLLAGHMPYVLPGQKANAHAVWRWVLDGPPAPLAARAPSAPPELVAIAEKAMARERTRRYPSMEALAEDLRAYLELRVVRAHRSGALVELQKWMQRNRLAAASLALVVLALASGGLLVARAESGRRKVLELESSRGAARLRLDRAATLGPLELEHLPAREAWLEEARLAVANELEPARAVLLEFERRHADAPRVTTPVEEAQRLRRSLTTVENKLADIERFVSFLESGDPQVLPPHLSRDLEHELAHVQRSLAILTGEQPVLQEWRESLARKLAIAPKWRYVEAPLAAEHDALRDFVLDLEALCVGPEALIPRLEGQIEDTRSLTAAAAESTAAWAEARVAILRSPHYGGLDLPVQAGLVPLGEDPLSGLWEFWHVLSGERPVRDSSGQFDVRPETGIVLVLVPGGTLRMGSQTRSPSEPNYFKSEASDCGDFVPAWCFELDVKLEPYLLARHELTQGQWYRMAGTSPARRWSGEGNLGKLRIDRTHPVESVSWNDAQRVLALHGLSLPTEAQLERAERTGTQEKYGTGPTLDTVLPFARCFDQLGESPWAYHAPVDDPEPNAWGFQGLYGNVAEWCLDGYATRCAGGTTAEGTGEIVPTLDAGYTYIPGSFELSSCFLAASARSGLGPDQYQSDLGLRAARRIQR